MHHHKCMNSVERMHVDFQWSLHTLRTTRRVRTRFNIPAAVQEMSPRPTPEQLANLATERERQLTMARANQTTGLTNGRAASRAPEVGFCQMTFPFCCQISQFSSWGGPRKQRKSSLSKNLLFSNWPPEGLTLLVMSTNSGNLGWFLFSDKKRMWCYSGYFLRKKYAYEVSISV